MHLYRTLRASRLPSAFFVSLLAAGLSFSPARADGLSLTLGIRMNCPYGLVG